MKFLRHGVLPALVLCASLAVGQANLDASRTLSDVRRHLEVAASHVQNGKWRRAFAHTSVVAPLGRIAYRIEVDDPRSNVMALRKAIQEGAEYWAPALEGQVEFVEDEAAAQVVVRFQESVQTNGREVGGHAKWVRSIAGLSDGELQGDLRANVWVRTVQPSGVRMTDSQLRHVIAHEFGHLLGLRDSSRPGDVMAPIDLLSPAKRPAPEELNAVRAIRELALDLRRQSLQGELLNLEGYNDKRAIR